MKKLCQKLVLISFIVALASCKDESANPGSTSTYLFSSMASNCLNSEPEIRSGKSMGTQSVNSSSKAIASDSIFTYSFFNDLIIDFSIIANCCPRDSTRFNLQQMISNDTIYLFVADKGGPGCYCDCLFMMHAQFSGLPGINYIVRCKTKNIDPIHLVRVLRYFAS